MLLLLLGCGRCVLFCGSVQPAWCFECEVRAVVALKCGGARSCLRATLRAAEGRQRYFDIFGFFQALALGTVKS